MKNKNIKFTNLGVTALGLAMSYISDSSIPITLAVSHVAGTIVKPSKNEAFVAMGLTGVMSLIADSYTPLLVGTGIALGAMMERFCSNKTPDNSLLSQAVESLLFKKKMKP